MKYGIAQLLLTDNFMLGMIVGYIRSREGYVYHVEWYSQYGMKTGLYFEHEVEPYVENLKNYEETEECECYSEI